MDFVEDVRLPPPARRLILQHWAARRRLEKEQGRADAAARAALHALLGLESASRTRATSWPAAAEAQKLRAKARA
jgi:hypothetical protein